MDTRRVVMMVVAFIVVAIAVSQMQAKQSSSRDVAASSPRIERGRYLVTVMDCNGCHTPFDEKGQPDMSRMLSGHPADAKISMPPPKAGGGWLVSINTTNTAWAGAWGISYTTNLTPDRSTGIGAWSEQNFIDAIRKGKKSGVGRPLLPPMPWANYAKLTDDDLRAIFAYLRTIKPIRNQVPPAVVAPTR